MNETAFWSLLSQYNGKKVLCYFPDGKMGVYKDEKLSENLNKLGLEAWYFPKHALFSFPENKNVLPKDIGEIKEMEIVLSKEEKLRVVPPPDEIELRENFNAFFINLYTHFL